MIEQAFEVATEFKFDVGEAILSSQNLRKAVDGVSEAANNALGSLSYLSSGLVAHLGLGSGGLLTILKQAVETSQQFDQQSLLLANNMSNNFATITGTVGTFNDRLRTSEMIMGKIGDAAVKFGLPGAQLTHMTEQLSTPLANRAKLGNNYEGAINLSKNVMLGSQAMGMNPQMVADGVYRAMTGNIGLHGMLFAKLANTPAFKAAGITKQTQFMGTNQDKKIDLLTKAFEQLGGNADFLAYHLGMLDTMFINMKNLIGPILRPIGKAVSGALKEVLGNVNSYLAKYGPKLGETVGKIIGDVFKNPEGLLVTLLQMRRLSSDFHKAFHIAGIVYMLSWLRELGLVGGGLVMRFIRPLLVFIKDMGVAIAKFIPWASIFRIASSAAAEFILAFLPIFFFLQILSRARAVAIVDDVKEWLKLAPEFADAILRLKNGFLELIEPFTEAIKDWADFLSPIFKTSIYARAAIPSINFLADSLSNMAAGVQFVISIFAGFIYQMEKLKTSISDMHFPSAAEMRGWYYQGQTSYLDDHLGRLGGLPEKTAPQTSNHFKVEIHNDFKEQMQPDRIAIALKDQLMKVAANRTQARGTSFSGAFASVSAAGGH